MDVPQFSQFSFFIMQYNFWDIKKGRENPAFFIHTIQGKLIYLFNNLDLVYSSLNALKKQKTFSTPSKQQNLIPMVSSRYFPVSSFYGYAA